MADYLPAYERMIIAEGGYRLHTTAGDRGGETYAGIARTRWPSWEGWTLIDRGEEPPAELVRAFYRRNFWERIRGDDIADARVATAIFSFAVNAGPATAARLAQLVCGVTPDGVVGPKTLAAINGYDHDLFLARYALARIARSCEIARRDATQRRFLLGWVRRALAEADP